MIKELESGDQLEAALRERSAVFFKHSPRCWISTRAMRHVKRYAEAVEEPTVYLIDVIGQRELSNILSERSGVPHASPQVIVMRDGRTQWHASHLDISAKALEANASE
jgi:bacillithiol system protein YtxJ